MIYQLDENYYVRPLTETDIQGKYPAWFYDQEICRYNSHGKFFKSQAYFLAYIDTLNQENQIVWAICHKLDGHIGNISLQAISFIDRTAEFAILLGEKQHWGKGIGLLAGKKLLHHGFYKLNLFRIYCGTAATNTGMIRLALKLGMQHEGTRRQHLFLEGNRVDILEYGILQTEYNSENHT